MNIKKNILVINAGSSSEKISFYQLDEKAGKETAPQSPFWQTEIDFPAGSVESVKWNDLLAKTLKPLINGETNYLSKESSIDVVGHRVVHGGDIYDRPVVINDEVKKNIEKYIPLAPLHNKVALMQIEAIEKLLPDTRQIAVFDTAFHRTLPDAVKYYPVPYSWHEEYGIQRFGFHGINHEYCAKQAAHALGKNISILSVITCHLGSGCSLAAVENGRSVNTTMGFTPLEGLMMASRSGSIDPSILLYLLKNKKMTVDQLDIELNKNSGLKGIAQTSDMKTIIEQMQNTDHQQNQRSTLAFDMFIQHLRQSICAMRASLQKLDALVFSAGIGENSALVREKACAGLSFLGIEIDEQANKNMIASKKPNNFSANKISVPHARVAILVINAHEDWAIAQQCDKLAKGQSVGFLS